MNLRVLLHHLICRYGDIKNKKTKRNLRKKSQTVQSFSVLRAINVNGSPADNSWNEIKTTVTRDEIKRLRGIQRWMKQSCTVGLTLFNLSSRDAILNNKEQKLILKSGKWQLLLTQEATTSMAKGKDLQKILLPEQVGEGKPLWETRPALPPMGHSITASCSDKMFACLLVGFQMTATYRDGWRQNKTRHRPEEIRGDLGWTVICHGQSKWVFHLKGDVGICTFLKIEMCGVGMGKTNLKLREVCCCCSIHFS